MCVCVCVSSTGTEQLHVCWIHLVRLNYCNPGSLRPLVSAKRMPTTFRSQINFSPHYFCVYAQLHNHVQYTTLKVFNHDYFRPLWSGPKIAKNKYWPKIPGLQYTCILYASTTHLRTQQPIPSMICILIVLYHS